METKTASSDFSGHKPAGGVRNDHILQQLRRRIVAGEFPPGSRLPTRDDLELHFGASRVTIQRALDKLGDEKFVVTEGRRGTFVAKHPPHLTRYALSFPSYPAKPHHWVRFWTALCSEAANLQQSGERTLPLYFGVDGHEDVEDYQRLVRDVQADRLAGIIFASAVHDLAATPLLRHATLPRVAMMSKPAEVGVDVPLRVPSAYPDFDSMMHKALAYFAARGRQRVAVVMPYHTARALELAIQAIADHGLTTHRYWIQRVSVSDAECAGDCVQLLMHSNQHERPDAILIADDNLVEHAIGGLLAAGVNVPGEVDVVVHCNFPHPPPSMLPVKRIGYDARQLLATCVASIDRQRRGESVPDHTKIPALFEEEISQ